MEQATNTSQRPTFLTVLCILTFIGCGIALIMSVLGYLATAALDAMAGGMLSAAAEEATKNLGDLGDMGGEAGEMLKGMGAEAAAAAATGAAMLKWNLVILLVNIVGVLLCLVGALQMWKLKKTGFFMWLAGEWIPLIATIVLIGFGGFAGFSMVIGLIGPIAFTIMYGLNMKHLR